MKVRVIKTIRRNKTTFVNGNIIELEEEVAQQMIKKGLVIPLDEEIADALAGDLKEVVKEVKVLISYQELKEFSIKELDAFGVKLALPLKGKKEEKAEQIWEHLSGDFLESDEEEQPPLDGEGEGNE